MTEVEIPDSLPLQSRPCRRDHTYADIKTAAGDVIGTAQYHEYIVHAANTYPTLVEALQAIAEHTDADNPESYRSDDREGCLDTIHARARAALKAAGVET